MIRKFWPFLNFVFNGLDKKSYSGLNLSNLISGKTYISTYLGFFGVPDGNYNTLFFANIPFLGIFLTLFLIGTLFFVFPLVMGFKRGKSNNIFYVLLGSFVILFLLYVVNVGPFVSRMLMPAVLALAFFYGKGMFTIIKKNHVIGNTFMILMIIISVGFFTIEIVKFSLASSSWNFYEEDFNWITENTDKNAIFVAGGQCIQYHIKRTSLSSEEIVNNKYDFVWLNQNFRLDDRAILTNDQLNILYTKDKELVYTNKNTKTSIYKIKR